MTESTLRLIETIKSIPKGKITSYRDVAARAGIPNGARQVVRVLHSLSEKYDLPWYRILKANGFIALDGEGRAVQIELLKKEGVKVSKEGSVDLEKYLWL